MIEAKGASEISTLDNGYPSGCVNDLKIYGGEIVYRLTVASLEQVANIPISS